MLSRQKHRGFSLIEVMVVVAIVGILLLVALPGFQSQLTKGRRADAMQALQMVAGRQENFMLDRSRYTTDLTEIGLDDPYESNEGHYTITAAAGGCGNIENCYLLTATPQADSPQADDTQCGNLTLSSTGAKGASGSLGNDCW